MPSDQILVGRTTELATLDRLLDDTIAGRPGVVAITGEPGMGKTTVLAELADRAGARGCAVLSGRAEESKPAPLAALLSTMDTRTGLVLLLDDLHWADAPTVARLGDLMRRPPAAPVLIALAFRPRQAPPGLLAVLAPAPGEARTWLDLPPLTPDEVGELLGPQLPAGRCRELYEASGGNPGYLAALREPADQLPAGILAELATLPAGTRAVALAAAVAGDPFDPELVAAIAAVPVAQALDSLDDLAARDLVRPETTARQFRFRHPLVRAAAYHAAGCDAAGCDAAGCDAAGCDAAGCDAAGCDAAGCDAAGCHVAGAGDPGGWRAEDRGGWRRAAHARAAAHLRERGAGATVQAPHVEQGLIDGDEHAIAVLSAAAESAARTTPAAAARWYEVAVRLLADGTDPRRGEFTLRRARALAATGQFAASRDLLTEPLPDPSQQVAAVALGARMQRLLGRYDRALAELTAALDGLPDHSGGDAAALRLELAYLCAQGGRLADAAAWATKVLDGPPPDRPVLLASATGLLALVHAYAGDHGRAGELVDRSVAVLDHLPDSALAGHLDVVQVAWAETVLRRHRDARRHFDRGVTIARRTGQFHVLAPLLFGLSTVETWLGFLAEASEHAESAVELAQTLGERDQYPAVLSALAEVAFQQGRLDDAGRYAREAIQARPDGTFLWTGHAEGVLARIRLATGDPAGCRDYLLQVGGGPDLRRYQVGMRPPWYDVLVQAELARGDLAAATGWADRSAALAPVFGAAEAHALSRARILAAAADPDDAREAVAVVGRVVEHYREVGMRVVEGEARQVLASALAASGDHGRAQEEIRRAKHLFAMSGAQRLYAQVVTEQRRLGAGKRRAGRAVAGHTLTEREHEVARLVSIGHSNRQIAGRLGMSVRTVESHLGHVFAKLGVTSRAGLASRFVASRQPFSSI
jgi:DNA-binding CsgD family transcriptional regulator/tetratricopeptide (TPR) repeat protein